MKYEVNPIGHIVASRTEATDDYWGGSRSSIVLEDAYEASALDGVEAFSHVEVLFLFDRVDPESVVCGALTRARSIGAVSHSGVMCRSAISRSAPDSARRTPRPPN